MQCLYVYVSFKSYNLIGAKRIQFAAHCSVISFADPAHIFQLIFLLEQICSFQHFQIDGNCDCNSELFVYI